MVSQIVDDTKRLLREAAAAEEERKQSATSARVVAKPLDELIKTNHARIDWKELLKTDNGADIDPEEARERYMKYWIHFRASAEVQQHPGYSTFSSVLKSLYPFETIDKYVNELRSGMMTWKQVETETQDPLDVFVRRHGNAQRRFNKLGRGGKRGT